MVPIQMKAGSSPLGESFMECPYVMVGGRNDAVTRST